MSQFTAPFDIQMMQEMLTMQEAEFTSAASDTEDNMSMKQTPLSSDADPNQSPTHIKALPLVPLKTNSLGGDMANADSDTDSSSDESLDQADDDDDDHDMSLGGLPRPPVAMSLTASLSMDQLTSTRINTIINGQQVATSSTTATLDGHHTGSGSSSKEKKDKKDKKPSWMKNAMPSQIPIRDSSSVFDEALSTLKEQEKEAMKPDTTSFFSGSPAPISLPSTGNSQQVDGFFSDLWDAGKGLVRRAYDGTLTVHIKSAKALGDLSPVLWGTQFKESEFVKTTNERIKVTFDTPTKKKFNAALPAHGYNNTDYPNIRMVVIPDEYKGIPRITRDDFYTEIDGIHKPAETSMTFTDPWDANAVLSFVAIPFTTQTTLRNELAWELEATNPRILMRFDGINGALKHIIFVNEKMKGTPVGKPQKVAEAIPSNALSESERVLADYILSGKRVDASMTVLADPSRARHALASALVHLRAAYHGIEARTVVFQQQQTSSQTDKMNASANNVMLKQYLQSVDAFATSMLENRRLSGEAAAQLRGNLLSQYIKTQLAESVKAGRTHEVVNALAALDNIYLAVASNCVNLSVQARSTQAFWNAPMEMRLRPTTSYTTFFSGQ